MRDFCLLSLRRLAVVALLGLLAGPAMAQVVDATFAGTVTDAETGQPIEDAHVFIADSMNGTVTDGEGRYRFVLRGYSLETNDRARLALDNLEAPVPTRSAEESRSSWSDYFGGVAWAAGFIGERLQSSDRAQRVLNRIAGTVFAGLALRLALSEPPTA